MSYTRQATDQEWQAAGDAGKAAVGETMTHLVIKLNADSDPAFGLPVAAYCGALLAIGELVRLLAGGRTHVAEQIALAYLRGAIRGRDEPLNADGSIFERAIHG